MKKLLPRLLALLCALLLPAAALGETIVASFFPVYLFARNLTEGVGELEVVCLTPPSGGCLHDYQLQTGDMKRLARADVFLINGAGMEPYLANVAAAFPELPIVDASTGIALLESCVEHDHDHTGHAGGHDHDTHDGDDHDDHDHEAEEHDHEAELAAHDGHDDHEYNAHIWLDAENAIIMVRNLADGLIARYPQHADAIAANRDAYVARLTALDAELSAAVSVLPHADVITFHEAFPYFAQAYGLHVVGILNREPEDALSPRALADLCGTVTELGNPPLFTEPQYDDAAARTISRETGAPVYTLDPIVTGPDDVPLTYYEDVMRANVQVLLEALAEK